MSAVLRFVVPGEPVPKGRARHRVVTPKKRAAFVHTYTPAKTEAFEKRVAILAQVAVNQARWSVDSKDRFSVIVRVFRTHEGAGGDLDNYLKACLDGMNKIAFPDDRYVRGIGAAFGEPDPARPRVEVEVRKFAPSKAPKA